MDASYSLLELISFLSLFDLDVVHNVRNHE
jgi:hypothetical protein